MSTTRALGAALLLAWAFAPALSRGAPAADFPEPPGLEPAVAFWSKVYLEVTTNGGLLHDHTHLNVVYEVVRFGDAQDRTRNRIKDRARDKWQDALRRLAGGAAPRDADESRVLRELETALGRRPTARDLRDAARRVRFQLGQRDKFREGVIRSGAYEDAMRDVFRQAGLPEDLAYLPHVESSFNVRAYSKYGAAGAWQFMRSTGRDYMRIDYEVDERLDPMVATVSAAKLLGHNYRVLESWPLALTAYNHGRAGMLRAKRAHGADIVRIVRRYQSRTFGFASRNFYAQFLAARRIMKSYESYFGQLRRDPPHVVDEVPLPFYLDVEDLATHLGVTEQVVRDLNPALRNPIFNSAKRIPKDYVLRLPAGTTGGNGERWLAALPADRRHPEQYRSPYYEVRRGDTLSGIARRNGTTVEQLVAMNNLRSRNRIYPGAVLQLPEPRGQKRPARVEEPRIALVSTARAATAPTPPTPPRPRSGRVPQMVPTPPRGRAEAPAEVASAQPPDLTPADPSVVSAQAQARAGGSPAAAESPVAYLSEDSPWRRIRGDTIIVDADETLGHYAEWLNIPTSRLRSINGLRYGRSLHMGQRIKLEFSRVTPEDFLQRRIEYHKGIAEDFFGSYEVVSVRDHRVRPGESIWQISTRLYGVPAWLIHRYNPEADLNQLTPGTRLTIPVVKAL